MDFQEFSDNSARSHKGKLNSCFCLAKIYPSDFLLVNLSRSFSTSFLKYLSFVYLYLRRQHTYMVKNFSGVSAYGLIFSGFSISLQSFFTSFWIFLRISPYSSYSSLKSLTQNKIVLGDSCLNWEIQIYMMTFSVSYCEPVYPPRALHQILIMSTLAVVKA